MKILSKNLILIALIIISGTILKAQDRPLSKYEAKIYGYVKNNRTKEGIFGVNIYIESVKKGTSTDENGYYEMIVPKGLFKISFTSVEMEDQVLTIDVIENKEINITMKEEFINLDEFTIYAQEEDANVRSLDVGKNTLDSKSINSLPSFLGEADVVKVMILMPGVSTVGEGASGFNVRGGGVDENLILQDGGQLFNSSHVFGFFSSFNAQMVKSATLYKGGIPAKYGGRLSSVLDVELIDGDFREYNLDAGVGIVSSKLAVNGPILKNKLSFAFGGRASYSDWLLNLVDDSDLKNSSAAFQDTNFKLTYLLGESDKISYSGYYSHDGFAFASDTAFQWSTLNHVLNWTHIFNDKLAVDTKIVDGRYGYNVKDDQGFDAFKVKSKIGYRSIKSDFEFLYSGHTANFGIEGIMYNFKPGTQKPLSETSGVDFLKIEKEQSIEAAIYAEDEFKFSEWLSVRGGLRYNYFINLGEGTDYIYGANDSRNINNIIDTVSYSAGEKIADYGGLSPRVSINAKLNSFSSVKASYNRTMQFIHLISNTAAVTPTDIWKTSNRYIEPARGHQYSLGYFRNLKNNVYEFSVEGYYKTADNIVDFKNGSAIFMNDNIEADLVQGESEAYGIELFIKKRTGKLTGWGSYTYSRTFRRITGEFDDEIISLGDWFPANFDKPHDVTFTMDYKPSGVFQMGANFTYSTGRPATVPLTIYDVSNLSNVYSFSKRNQGRIPDYHRLDISFTFKSRPRTSSKFRTSWVFSIYNLYGRKNAYSVFYENRFGSPPKAYKLSVLGTAFPSLTFNLELLNPNKY